MSTKGKKEKRTKITVSQSRESVMNLSQYFE